MPSGTRAAKQKKHGEATRAKRTASADSIGRPSQSQVFLGAGSTRIERTLRGTTTHGNSRVNRLCNFVRATRSDCANPQLAIPGTWPLETCATCQVRRGLLKNICPRANPLFSKVGAGSMQGRIWCNKRPGTRLASGITPNNAACAPVAFPNWHGQSDASQYRGQHSGCSGD